MSTKSSTQQARRAPLSLTSGGKQVQQQQQSNKGSSDSNGSSSTNVALKNDMKNSNQKVDPVVETKDINQKELKKPQNAEKKPQSTSGDTTKKTEKAEDKKSQNGVGKGSGGAVQKEKQQNGNDEKAATNVNEKDKIESSSKEDTKNKEEKVAQSSNDKKEKEPEKRSKRSEAVAIETEKKKIEKSETVKSDVNNSDGKGEAIVSAPAPNTPPSTRSSSAATPTKAVEKASTNIAKASEKSNTPQKKTANAIAVDDVEMESLVVDPSPEKKPQRVATPVVTAVAVNPPPAATSTPGKALIAKKQQAAAKSEVPAVTQISGTPDRSSCPRSFQQISGRRSIRPMTEYTPSKLQSSTQFRESYRRINTDLDVSSTTNNTSLNVTVGSERPNSSSFFFFGRGRKRDRTPPQSQSTIELQTDADYSPPKRARLDMQGFFSAVASPLTLLRARFSKTSIQSSTPVKLSLKQKTDDEGEVQNVSGISIEEVPSAAENEEKTATEDVTMEENVDDILEKDSPTKEDESADNSDLENDDDVYEKAEEFKTSEIPDIAVVDVVDTPAKSKRCSVM